MMLLYSDGINDVYRTVDSRQNTHRAWKWDSMSQSVFGKYALGVVCTRNVCSIEVLHSGLLISTLTQLSVLMLLAPFSTSAGMFEAERGQNQTCETISVGYQWQWGMTYLDEVWGLLHRIEASTVVVAGETIRAAPPLC